MFAEFGRILNFLTTCRYDFSEYSDNLKEKKGF